MNLHAVVTEYTSLNLKKLQTGTGWLATGCSDLKVEYLGGSGVVREDVVSGASDCVTLVCAAVASEDVVSGASDCVTLVCEGGVNTACWVALYVATGVQTPQNPHSMPVGGW